VVIVVGGVPPPPPPVDRGAPPGSVYPFRVTRPLFFTSLLSPQHPSQIKYLHAPRFYGTFASMNRSISADVFLRDLALAIARNQVGAAAPTHEVLAAEGVTQQEYDAIKTNPTFSGYVTAYVKELTDSGFSFAAKCRVLAEELLADSYHMAKDPDVPAAVRAKVVENLVKWGDLEPRKNVEAVSGPGFSITINIPGATPTVASQRTADADVVDVPTLTLPTKTKKETGIYIDEPESYEYAGDDYL
jgi:hypothetical protein